MAQKWRFFTDSTQLIHERTKRGGVCSPGVESERSFLTLRGKQSEHLAPTCGNHLFSSTFPTRVPR